MSHSLSSTNSAGNKDQWDRAIADARARLRRVEAKALRLRLALKTFETGKAEGEPWPGNSDAKPAA